MNFRSAAAVGLAVCGLALGCSDPSDQFHGVWEATSLPADTVVVNGEPLMALGHYGREVSGIVYYRIPGGSRFDPACPCSYVEHLSYNADDSRMKFETGCEDASRRLWSLELMQDATDGQPVIAATVRYADGQGSSDYMEFQRVDREVPTRQKACPPE